MFMVLTVARPIVYCVRPGYNLRCNVVSSLEEGLGLNESSLDTALADKRSVVRL